jgi:LysM repeat protein/ABC-type branched-subunit amino acid transport system substrate-binding protein
MILLTTVYAVAQDIVISTKIEKINNKDYYIHIVKKGQTVSAIARAYSVTVDEIYSDNPDAKKGLSIDQQLKIRVKQEQKSSAENDFTEHTVKEKETLFKIAKLYDLKVDEIMAANPGLTEALKVGQVIKIPKKKQSVTTNKKDNKKVEPVKPVLKTYSVQKGETLYSISKMFGVTVDELKKVNPGLNEALVAGQVIYLPENSLEPKVVENKIPETKIVEEVKFECGKTGKKEEYNIAVMIPFFLDNPVEIDTSSDEDSPVYSFKSFSCIQFYEGAMIAFDSLKAAGLKANIYVYDINDETSKTEEILSKPEMKKMDLIIGPFYSSNFTTVAAWAKQNKVKIVNPFSSKNENIVDNEYAFKLTLSGEEQIDELFKFLKAEYPDENILLVYTNTTKDPEILKPYSDGYAKHFQGKKLTEINYYADGGLTGLTSKLDESKINIILSVVNGEAFISNYIRSLRDLPVKYRTIMFGNKIWESYTSLELEYLLNLNFHSWANSYIEYRKPHVQNFVNEFRNRYGIEPDTIAFQGYDIANYFIGALMKYGTNFEKCLKDYSPELLQTRFDFIKVENGGFRNSYLNIYRYEDYKEVDARISPKKEIELIVKPDPPPKKPHK